MIYDYTITTGKGEELHLEEYKGKVILVVNTAFEPTADMSEVEECIRSLL